MDTTELTNPFDVSQVWYVDRSVVTIETDKLQARVFVRARTWGDPKWKPFDRVPEGLTPYGERKIAGPETDFILLARATANDEGASAPYLADWLQEHTLDIDLTPESWERLCDTVRRCSPQNTAAAIHGIESKKVGFLQSEFDAPVVPSADLHSGPRRRRPGHSRRNRPGSGG